jgi:hypothetical protein
VGHAAFAGAAPAGANEVWSWCLWHTPSEPRCVSAGLQRASMRLCWASTSLDASLLGFNMLRRDAVCRWGDANPSARWGASGGATASACADGWWMVLAPCVRTAAPTVGDSSAIYAVQPMQIRVSAAQPHAFGTHTDSNPGNQRYRQPVPTPARLMPPAQPLGRTAGWE